MHKLVGAAMCALLCALASLPLRASDASNEAFSASLADAASGSLPAVEAVARSLSCLDGGNLEDAHVALGEALFGFPESVTPVLESEALAPDALANIAVMLPTELVDAPCDKRDALERRRATVMRIDAFDSAKPAMMEALASAIERQARACGARQP